MSKFSLGLEISHNWLKMVQMEKLGARKPFVSLLPIENDSLYTEGYLQDYLKDVIKEQKKELATRKVSVCVSDIPCFSKILEVESQEKSVKDVIAWEIEQHVTGSVQDYYYDFYPAQRLNEPHLNYFLAVAVRRTLLDPIIREIREANLSPVALETEYCSMVNLIEYCYPDQNKNVVAVVDIGNRSFKYIVCFEGMFYFCHSEPHPQEFESFDRNSRSRYLKNVCNFIQEKIKEKIEGSKHLSGKQVVQMFICGDLFFKNQEAVDFVISQFSIPAHILNPFKGTDLENEDYSTICAVPVGLAVREMEKE
jgi:Tfp pilus assembly PilM family ATPase